MPSWADEVDHTDRKFPSQEISAPDANAIKTITNYYINENGKKCRKVTRVKDIVKTVKISRRMEERKQWEKFGNQGGQKSVSTISTEEIFVEKPVARGELAKKKEKTEVVNFSAFHARLEARKRGELGDDDGAAGGDPRDPNSIAVGGKGKYVPPSLRGGADGKTREGTSMHQRDDTSTLRITNISDETEEQDLHSLFSAFGAIQRIYLAKDKYTGLPRGFAFINYYSRSDAEGAIEKLHGYGLDNLILNVEWAKPKDPETGR